MKLNDIIKGLKDAWEFVLNTIDEELTIDYIKKVTMLN